MKVIRSSKDGLVLQLGRKEKTLLFDVLKLYPCIPSAHHQLTKKGRLPDQEASQRLLDEALAEQRADNKRQLQALLTDPRRFHETQGGCRVSLSLAELEWLLQILNDIRVGSWVILGAPEERLEVLNEQTAPHIWAMQLAGHFQMQLLAALEERER